MSDYSADVEIRKTAAMVTATLIGGIMASPRKLDHCLEFDFIAKSIEGYIREGKPTGWFVGTRDIV